MSTVAAAGTARLGSFSVNRMGYGAMQLAGRNAFGSRDAQAGAAVLREAIAQGVNHIDTSDYYGPFLVNELIRQTLAPYPDDLALVTKIGARRAVGTLRRRQSPDWTLSPLNRPAGAARPLLTEYA